MAWEAPRTLFTLTSTYQNADEKFYEVIVIDNGSTPPDEGPLLPLRRQPINFVLKLPQKIWFPIIKLKDWKTKP